MLNTNAPSFHFYIQCSHACQTTQNYDYSFAPGSKQHHAIYNETIQVVALITASVLQA